MLELIKSRRSIRNFSSEKIGKSVIESILEAAMYAPSARNKQSWHFVVITEKNRLVELSDIHPYAGMLKTASCCIIVCGDSRLEESIEYNAINCSAATQNILLALHSLGLGGVWLGIYPRKERMSSVSGFLGLPDHIFPVTAVAAGYPNEKPPHPERFHPERIHYEKF